MQRLAPQVPHFVNRKSISPFSVTDFRDATNSYPAKSETVLAQSSDQETDRADAEIFLH